MIAAIPSYREYAGGMGGGPDNPLGARALYLYRGGRDTCFRLHGTDEPETIGGAVSSGCIRLFNQDIMDLGTQIMVCRTKFRVSKVFLPNGIYLKPKRL